MLTRSPRPESGTRKRCRRAIVSLLTLAGCSHAPSPAERAQAFRQLQLHEAELSRAAAQRRSAGPDCTAELRAFTHELCQAAERVCAQSERLHDPDADARCRRAQDSCHAARGHERAVCATDPP